MKNRPTVAFLVATVTAGLISGCGARLGSRGPATQRQGDGTVLVVLLPDAEDGTIGRVVVSNPAGTAELTAAGQSISISPNLPPSAVTLMSEANVRQRFGAVLASLPPAPQHAMLYFRFESDDLTEESLARLSQVAQAVKDWPFPDIAVIGHTDTAGTSSSNVALGMRRAAAVRSRLVETGVDASIIEVISHGEADQLLKTADEIPEPLNRRVEITIR